MANKKIRIKTMYLLLWLILVCAGILVRTGTSDYLWQLVYNGIYDSKAENVMKAGSCLQPDVCSYMDYWEKQVHDVCDTGMDKSAQNKKDATEDATEDAGKDVKEDTSQGKQDDKSQIGKDKSSTLLKTVSAMEDITDSYIGMDSDTLLSYCYNVTYPGCVKSDELNAENLLGKDMKLDMSTEGYKVLIYHSHGSESFADSRPGEEEDTVVGLGDYLTELLTEKYGIPVYHDRTRYDMVTGSLDRNASYDYSRAGVCAILEENPGIEVIIDLHRDGVPDDTRLVTEVDGRATAQIMLINGMCRDEEGNDVDYWSNDYKVDNMAFALQTYLAGRANYGDIMRKIYISTCRYNMDLMPHAMLAEIGAQTSTVEEARNAIEPFASMLAKVLLQ